MCDSNIGFSSFAPHLVIALSILRQQKLSLLISLLKFFNGFCRLVHGFFFVLLPIQLSLFKLLRLLSSERRQRKVTVIFSLSPLRARKRDNYTIIILYFGGSNNIFVDCIFHYECNCLRCASMQRRVYYKVITPLYNQATIG